MSNQGNDFFKALKNDKYIENQKKYRDKNKSLLKENALLGVSIRKNSGYPSINQANKSQETKSTKRKRTKSKYNFASSEAGPVVTNGTLRETKGNFFCIQFKCVSGLHAKREASLA